MPRQVFLVRHGISEKSGTLLGQYDAELTPEGRSQAIQLADRLTDLGLDRVLSSPLRRAMRTAEPIASRFDLEIETDSRLQEISYGQWDGQTWQEIERANPQAALLKNENWWEVTAAGGESWTDFYRRVAGAWRDLLAHPARRTALVAHRGVNAILFDLANHPRWLDNEGSPPNWPRIAHFEQAHGAFLELSLDGETR